MENEAVKPLVIHWTGRRKGRSKMMRPLHVVLVDDNPDDREIVARYLQREFPELRITHIAKPEDLEAALKECDFDILITDYQLHWTDGLSVLKRVKSCCPDCPVIMFTGTGSEEVAVEAMKAGLDDYVIKTARHLPRLAASVRTAIERAEERAKAKEIEQRYRQLFTSLPVGVFRASVDGRWIDANPAMLRVLKAVSFDSLSQHSFLASFRQLPRPRRSVSPVI